MNKRLRQWPILVYNFFAFPEGKIPQEIWECARAMMALWNQLLLLRTATLEKTSHKKGKDGEKIEVSKEDRKAAWDEYNHKFRQILNDSPLNWECSAEVGDRFSVASKKAMKEHAILRPKLHLDKMAIPHRLTGGGMPIEKFFNNERGWRYYLKSVPREVYFLTANPRRRACFTDGSFGLKQNPKDKATIFPFHAILHREVPPGSILKKITWCGKYCRYRHRWSWGVQLSVELPPSTFDNPARDGSRKGRVAGIDLGWRKILDGSALRIGVLVDNEGNELELRLPITKTSDKTAKRVIHEFNFQTFRDLMLLDERIGNAVETCKEQIKEILPTLPPGFVKMRQFGLRRIMRLFEDPNLNATRHDALDEYKWARQIDWRTQNRIRQIIQDWSDLDYHYWKIKEGTSAILVARRQHYYAELALWLTNRYEEIVWKGDLNVKHMREQHDNPALENAKKQSNWAAIGEFRRILQHSVKKQQNILTGAEAAYSTITENTDPYSGKFATPSADVELLYPSGNYIDQDRNSALNLLRFATLPTKPRKKTPLNIPPILEDIIVPLMRATRQRAA